MSLRDIYNARRNPDLLARTEAAVLYTSNYIQGEVGTVTNHAERLAAANANLSSDAYLSTFVNAMMFPISTDSAISADPEGVADSNIQYQVDFYFTTMALRYPPA